SPWGFAPARLSAKSQVKKFSSQSIELTEEELSMLLEHAFDRYFENSSLFGTPAVCLKMVNQLRAVGVNEIACLIDFGVDSQLVLDHLRYLSEVKDLAHQTSPSVSHDSGLAALISRHRVTHLQCTPSMARLLVSQSDTAAALSTLRKLMIGGE